MIPATPPSPGVVACNWLRITHNGAVHDDRGAPNVDACLLRHSRLLAMLGALIVFVGCAPPSSAPGDTHPRDQSPAAVGGLKRVVAAIQGEPVALSTTVNPSGSAGS